MWDGQKGCFLQPVKNDQIYPIQGVQGKRWEICTHG